MQWDGNNEVILAPYYWTSLALEKDGSSRDAQEQVSDARYPKLTLMHGKTPLRSNKIALWMLEGLSELW